MTGAGVNTHPFDMQPSLERMLRSERMTTSARSVRHDSRVRPVLRPGPNAAKNMDATCAFGLWRGCYPLPVFQEETVFHEEEDTRRCPSRRPFQSPSVERRRVPRRRRATQAPPRWCTPCWCTSRRCTHRPPSCRRPARTLRKQRPTQQRSPRSRAPFRRPHRPSPLWFRAPRLHQKRTRTTLGRSSRSRTARGRSS